MKAFLLVMLLAGTSLAARAQTYYLNLTSPPLDLPNLAVAVEQVVDGRAGQPAIGVVYRGWGGKSAAVAFREGLGPALTTFVHALLPAHATAHTVVLCVRSLHIGETVGGTKEQAFADMTADVYAYLPDGYHFVQSVGAHASSYGFEATGRHTGHLAQMLGQCLGQVAPAKWEAVARQPARTLAQLPADAPVAPRRAAAILREVPRRGLYYSIDQFLANRPDTTQAFAIEAVRLRYRSRWATVQWLLVARTRPVLFDSAGRRPVPAGLWGFSDGQQAFVQHIKQFFPLMRQGNCFTFVGEAPPDQQYARAQAQAQGRASVVGVSSVGAVTDHSSEPTPYSLDLRTGAVAPYPNLGSPARTDTAYLYVYRAPQDTGVALVKVYVDGREMGSLPPGQYLELPWAHYGKHLRLCISGLPTATPCQYLVPNTAQLNYLRLDATSTAQPWQWVTPAQGSADLDELDKLLKTTK